MCCSKSGKLPESQKEIGKAPEGTAVSSKAGALNRRFEAKSRT
jgi:hypothetical protein